MKIVTVVGARPQFVKAAPVSRAFVRAGLHEVLVHTGQHYDGNMSAIFFDELGIPAPDYELGVGSGSHGAQTADMLRRIEEVLIAERPDAVLVYGDTNSTLAGALSAAKLHIPVAHVEAGLRSFNRAMPEELNRVVTDHLSSILLCPSQPAVENLRCEGIEHDVHIVGDVMYDALLHTISGARDRSGVLEALRIDEGRFLLATLHRAENTDNPTRLQEVFSALSSLDETVIFPVHPRTRRALEAGGLIPEVPGGFTVGSLHGIEPVGYCDMVRLVQGARLVLTDSGGLQKEAYWLKTPCITLRDETEWVETVTAGWNTLAGTHPERIRREVEFFCPSADHLALYGDGASADLIVSLLGGISDQCRPRGQCGNSPAIRRSLGPVRASMATSSRRR